MSAARLQVSIGAAFMVLALANPASATNLLKLSPGELARVINSADALSVPYRKAKIAASDIRIIRCIGPDEEPTEFECTWRHHSRNRWVARKTWIAIDGRGWHVID